MMQENTNFIVNACTILAGICISVRFLNVSAGDGFHCKNYRSPESLCKNY
jgi:hypothetical protein